MKSQQINVYLGSGLIHVTGVIKINMYHQTPNTRHTKSLNFNVSRLILQLSLPNPLKPGIKYRMKMQLEKLWQAMLQLHLSDQQFYYLLRCGLY